ncbi:unnamed protein product [Cylicocyclus nassatus]|uniref:Uncharacterized protein n=1 Tax=Cylicocyclus nassatus TaxID=53992 RepID=A0AA36GPP9_CYLNA|nr:unnamed protein product [Cylicocyclus nassatus]
MDKTIRNLFDQMSLQLHKQSSKGDLPKRMTLLQLAIVLTAVVGGITSIAFQNECNNPTPPQKNESLPAFKVPQPYKITGVITNWTNKTVAAITELAKSDQITTLVSDRDSTLHYLFTNPDSRFLHNQTSGKCAASSSSPLSAYPQLSLVAKDLSSLSTMISGLMNFSKSSPGEFRDNRVVAGVEGVRWVACVSGTNATSSLQVEVIFAGDSDQSLKPPSPAFNNPLLLFVRVAEFGNFSDNSTLKSVLSVELDSYNVIAPEDERLFETPAGTVCDGWKEAKIPLNVSDKFSAVVQNVDDKKMESESMLYYSPAEEMVIISGARQSDMFPFVNEKGVPSDASLVIHDFNKGYEYALDSSRCVRLSPLPNNTADVLSTAQGVLSIAPIANMLIAPELKFGNYGRLLASNGQMLDIYRAVDGKTNDVVEAHFDGVQLESYAVYKLVNQVPVLSTFMRFIHGPTDIVPTFSERIRSCFTQSAPSFDENNTFIFDVKSKTVKDVHSVGVETVSLALGNALAQVAPINPYRIRVFYDTNAAKTLRVFFSIDEKSSVVPSAVQKYNYTAEVPSAVLIEKLNATIVQGDWKFSVPTIDKKQEDWVVAAKSLSRYAPPTHVVPTYMGYTGGAMFVLGIFSMILGVAIGAGGVFFITKRQRISTLAYQVFE